MPLLPPLPAGTAHPPGQLPRAGEARVVAGAEAVEGGGRVGGARVGEAGAHGARVVVVAAAARVLRPRGGGDGAAAAVGAGGEAEAVKLLQLPPAEAAGVRGARGAACWAVMVVVMVRRRCGMSVLSVCLIRAPGQILYLAASVVDEAMLDRKGSSVQLAASWVACWLIEVGEVVVCGVTRQLLGLVAAAGSIDHRSSIIQSPVHDRMGRAPSCLLQNTNTHSSVWGWCDWPLAASLNQSANQSTTRSIHGGRVGSNRRGWIEIGAAAADPKRLSLLLLVVVVTAKRKNQPLLSASLLCVDMWRLPNLNLTTQSKEGATAWIDRSIHQISCSSLLRG